MGAYETMRIVWDIIRLAVCLGATMGVGFAGSMYTAPAIGNWYAGLQKPPFNPPNWVFMPVWTALYAMMAVAAFLVWRAGFENRWTRPALLAFVVQLGLNFLWSLLFFGRQQPFYALLDIAALWIMIVVTMVLFLRVSRPAGLLLVPYLAWVTFASVLNFELWRLNR